MSSRKDVDYYLETLKKYESIKEIEIQNLCLKAKEIFANEPNLVHVESPVTVEQFLK